MLKGYSLQIRTRVQFRAVGFRLGCSSCFRNNFLDYESFVIEVEIVRRGLQEPAMQQAVCMSARGLQTHSPPPLVRCGSDHCHSSTSGVPHHRRDVPGLPRRHCREDIAQVTASSATRSFHVWRASLPSFLPSYLPLLPLSRLHSADCTQACVRASGRPLPHGCVA